MGRYYSITFYSRSRLERAGFAMHRIAGAALAVGALRLPVKTRGARSPPTEAHFRIRHVECAGPGGVQAALKFGRFRLPATRPYRGTSYLDGSPLSQKAPFLAAAASGYAQKAVGGLHPNPARIPDVYGAAVARDSRAPRVQIPPVQIGTAARCIYPFREIIVSYYIRRRVFRILDFCRPPPSSVQKRNNPVCFRYNAFRELPGKL